MVFCLRLIRQSHSVSEYHIEWLFVRSLQQNAGVRETHKRFVTQLLEDVEVTVAAEEHPEVCSQSLLLLSRASARQHATFFVSLFFSATSSTYRPSGNAMLMIDLVCVRRLKRWIWSFQRFANDILDRL